VQPSDRAPDGHQHGCTDGRGVRLRRLDACEDATLARFLPPFSP
jgi:hypothetical protein